MDIKETVLGNASEPAWKKRLEGARIDWLELSQWDAQKNRFRRKTQEGRVIAVALERGRTLRDGDILEWDEAARHAVVCRIRLCPVMAVDMHGLTGLPVEEALRSAVRLGHALGNQHWPAVVKENVVFVPVSTGTDVASSVMETHAVPGTTYLFLPGEDVLNVLNEQEARRLFGGAESTGGHSHHHDGHGPEGGHGHSRKHSEQEEHESFLSPGRKEERAGSQRHGKHDEGADKEHRLEMRHAGVTARAGQSRKAGDRESRERRGPHGYRQRGHRHGHYDDV